MIGRVLGGRYAVEARVGGGGMATVYRGLDTLLDRPVALKVLRVQLAGDPDFVRRFRREARAAASLSHPHIIGVYDVGSEGAECHYIVQEYVDGETLKERIAREGPLAPDEALGVMQQVLDALGHAHRLGVVHRDVKPQNVLLTREGRVKVTDFGIALAEVPGGADRSYYIVGTAHYAAPEQVRGDLTDARSDIYSAGVMFYEMLTGSLPFPGERPVAVAVQQVTAEPPDPALLRPLPPGFSAVVAHALRKVPEQRYRTAGEFREDIDALAAGRAPAHAWPAPGHAEAPWTGGAPAVGPNPTVGPVAVLAAAGAARGTGASPASSPELAVPVRTPGGRGRPARRHTGSRSAAARRADTGPPTGPAPTDAARLIGIAPVRVNVPAAAGRSAAAGLDMLRPWGRFARWWRSIRARRLAVWSAVLVAALAGASVAVARSLRRQAVLAVVAVPTVVGWSAASGEAALHGLGLTWRLTSEVAPLPAGDIVRLNPPAGSLVHRGGRVQVLVSAGPGTVTLPDVVGLPEGEARTEMTGAGLVVHVSDVSEYSPSVPAGDILVSTPPSGTVVPQGGSVTLVLSAGPRPLVLMPNYAGTPEVAVAAALKRRKLTVGRLVGEPTGWPTGVVAATVPVAGARVPAGTPVDLLVSTGCVYTAPLLLKAGTGASTATGGTGRSAGALPQSAMREAVLVQNAGGAHARLVFTASVRPGHAFRVHLCWSSPRGASWTWEENGVVRAHGHVSPAVPSSLATARTSPVGGGTAASGSAPSGTSPVGGGTAASGSAPSGTSLASGGTAASGGAPSGTSPTSGGRGPG